MSLHILCEELANCLLEIDDVNRRMGELNHQAVTLQNKAQALQALRQRIEVDLTKIKLEVL